MEWYGRVGAVIAAAAAFAFWFLVNAVPGHFVTPGARMGFDFVASGLQLLVAYWFGLQYDKMRFWASRDPDTGVWNRRSITKRLADILARASGTDEKVALYIIDVDGLKAINDNEGHLAGDVAIRTLACALVRLAGKRDGVGRLGGDEFLLIQRASAPDLAQKTTDALYRLLGASRVKLRASVGYALYPNDAATSKQLLKIADNRMYEEKRRHQTQRPFDYGHPV